MSTFRATRQPVVLNLQCQDGGCRIVEAAVSWERVAGGQQRAILQAFEQAGMDSYVSKPVDARRLFENIDDVLGRSAAAAAALLEQEGGRTVVQ